MGQAALREIEPSVVREPETEIEGHGEIPYRTWVVVTGTLSLLSLVAIRAWQGAWWFPEGTDATTWEFATYWMSLLYIEFGVLAIVGAIALFAYWKPCPVCDTHRREHGRILPAHENQHIGKLWSTIALAAIFGLGVTYFAEQDAAWHQVVVRDSTFTPSHIPLFFYTFPLVLIFTFQTSWYAYRRLHHLYVDEKEGGIPVAYLLFPAGGLVLTANVALNEWGHSTWITEELFVQPFHWPFAWALYFFLSATAIIYPTTTRFFENVLELHRREATKNA